MLCIVNRIADAQKIYQALPKDGAYCLTTHLCPAHRKARIKEIRERLKIGLPCRVVSTSLIEAGVDVVPRRRFTAKKPGLIPSCKPPAAAIARASAR